MYDSNPSAASRSNGQSSPARQSQPTSFGNRDSGIPIQSLKVDGFQADQLNVPVVRPKITETSALGAAYAAGLAVGFWNDTNDLRNQWHEDRRWLPQIGEAERSKLYRDWLKAVERSFTWVE